MANLAAAGEVPSTSLGIKWWYLRLQMSLLCSAMHSVGVKATFLNLTLKESLAPETWANDHQNDVNLTQVPTQTQAFHN